MRRDRLQWCTSAAYVYALHLDPAALAWEYLRRNPRYVADWQANPADCAAVAAQWGLGALENPYLDAWFAQPMWRPRPESELRIMAIEEAPACALRFDLWALPGEKMLMHDGRRLVLSFQDGSSPARIAIDLQLHDGTPFGYVIPSRVTAWPPPRRFDTIVRSSARLNTRAFTVAARRDAIVHMQTLQALDGVLAHASQRDVANALFGLDRVMTSWLPDGELRAKTRYYIRRGRALMTGAYHKRMLQPSTRKNIGQETGYREVRSRPVSG